MQTYAANIGDELTSLFGDVLNVAVKVLVFLLIMMVGWFIVRWVHRWLTRLLQRLGFDRAVDSGGLARVLGNYRASDLVARVVGFGLLLVTLQLAFGIFGPNPVSDLIAGVVAWLPQLFVGIVIVVVAAAIAGWVRDLITRALAGFGYGRTLATIAQVLILAFGAFAALDQIGIATDVTNAVLIAGLATAGGILIVGVGGGLIKPMQHRWERMLIRAETETAMTAAKIREARAAERTVNLPGTFGQAAYSSGATGQNVKPPPAAPPDAAPTAGTPATGVSPPPGSAARPGAE